MQYIVCENFISKVCTTCIQFIEKMMPYTENIKLQFFNTAHIPLLLVKLLIKNVECDKRVFVEMASPKSIYFIRPNAIKVMGSTNCWEYIAKQTVPLQKKVLNNIFQIYTAAGAISSFYVPLSSLYECFIVLSHRKLLSIQKLFFRCKVLLGVQRPLCKLHTSPIKTI